MNGTTRLVTILSGELACSKPQCPAIRDKSNPFVFRFRKPAK